jgi:hypothetical protein
VHNALQVPIVKKETQVILDWIKRVKYAIPNVRVVADLNNQQLIVNYSVLSYRQRLLLDMFLFELT